MKALAMVRSLGAIVRKRTSALFPVNAPSSGGVFFRFFGEDDDPTFDFQRDQHHSRETILAMHAVWSCMTRISSDIAKLRIKLVQQTGGVGGIWKEIASAAFSPVLTKPNGYQTRIGFLERWVLSKLSRGNTYVLKERDQRGVVIAMHVLNPDCVLPLMTEDGGVYYQLNLEYLAGVTESIVVPASEIIHDRGPCLYHPLIGVSPIYACGLAAAQALSIQRTSEIFFLNGARPSGVLTAPGMIGVDLAKRMKEEWDKNYAGKNRGKTAVLGEGLKYEKISVDATDAQLVEQLKWSAEIVCSVFHVPAFMVGMGAAPAYNNIEALNQQYYSQCLQIHIEEIEIALDEGLGLVSPTNSFGTELDMKGLLRMDTATRFKAHSDGISGGWLKPNEARAEEDLDPVEGGDTPYMQQQNYSLAALAKQSAAGIAPKPPAEPADPGPGDTPDDAGEHDETDDAANQQKFFAAFDREIEGVADVA